MFHALLNEYFSDREVDIKINVSYNCFNFIFLINIHLGVIPGCAQIFLLVLTQRSLTGDSVGTLLGFEDQIWVGA